MFSRRRYTFLRKPRFQRLRGSLVRKEAFIFRGRLCNLRRACGHWGEMMLLQLPRRNLGESGRHYKIRRGSMVLPSLTTTFPRRA